MNVGAAPVVPDGGVDLPTGPYAYTASVTGGGSSASKTSPGKSCWPCGAGRAPGSMENESTLCSHPREKHDLTANVCAQSMALLCTSAC